MVDQKLIEAAVRAHNNAHSPYSVPVGAAVCDERGKIFGGCNVQNASHPEGICAETAAIAAMITDGGRRIMEVVVVRAGAEPGMPCGGCRQRIREFAKSDCPIHICNEVGNHMKTVTLGELLPLSFGPEHLGTK
jgi:cytidine deaminase